MQAGSHVFANDAERRAFLKAMEAKLIDGRPGDAVVDIETRARGLHDRNGERVGFRIHDQGALRVRNWSSLWDRLSAADVDQHHITAIGFNLSWPGHISAKPDDQGHLSPIIETNYYSDGPYSFSTSARDEYQQAVSKGFCPWQGEFEDVEAKHAIEGIDTLYGAVQLQAARGGRTPQEEDAYQMNAALAAIAVHIAVKRTITEHGLPRPLAVLVGSNEDFPFFEAPVATFEESQSHWETTPPFADGSNSQAVIVDDEPVYEDVDDGSEERFENVSNSNRQRADEWVENATDRMADAIKSAVTNPSTRKTIATIGTLALDAVETASRSQVQKNVARAFGKVIKKL